MDIGILGAGAVGGALAKLAADRGHGVMISSRHPDSLAGLAAGIGCRLGSLERAAGFGALCVAAVPFMALDSLPAEKLAGKVVIDAMNHHPERDGPVAPLDEKATTTSELAAGRLPGARLVKAFNATLAKDLPDDARPPVFSGRRALPIAGNDPAANRIVAELHDAFGFDALDTGSLARSWRLERAKPACCIPLDMDGFAGRSTRRPAMMSCRMARGGVRHLRGSSNPLRPNPCSGQKAPHQPGSLAMNDTSPPGPTKPARRFGAPRQKVPPFARYEGTSAWRKNRRRAREYARFRAAANRVKQSPATPNP